MLTTTSSLTVLELLTSSINAAVGDLANEN